MDDATSIALATVALGAVLGGLIQGLIAWRDRIREGRAAALVVWSALTEATMATHAPQGKPFAPVFIDFDAYAVVWADERKALARTLRPPDYKMVSDAFEELRTLGRREARADDLKDTVFDRMLDASKACEFGRRIAWAYAQSRRARMRRWFNLRREAVRKRWGYIVVARRFRKAERGRTRNGSGGSGPPVAPPGD